jgi:hypothetical protein
MKNNSNHLQNTNTIPIPLQTLQFNRPKYKIVTLSVVCMQSFPTLLSEKYRISASKFVQGDSKTLAPDNSSSASYIYPRNFFCIECAET